MSNVLSVNQRQFESEVLYSQLPVVVDFYANWCPPCRRLSPILDRLAAEFDGQIKFVKINSDEQQQLATTYNVRALPTLVMFDQGDVVDQFEGLPPEKDLRDELAKWVEARKIAN